MVTKEEKQIIEQILEYCETGKTSMTDEIMHNPVSNYNDPKKLNAEINTLFREFPIIVAHVSELSEPGQFITHNDTGVPILVTRNNDNELKAFMNVCRHRGAKVEGRECGKAKTFSCPYHSWTYDLNGKLRGMPQPFGFDNLDKSKYGLKELPVYEYFGMVWVRPSADAKRVDMAKWLAPMESQFNALNLDNHIIYKKWTLPRNMSWRLALEGFQENYHFCSAHEHTACSGYLDNQSVFTNHYPHVRHSVPLWNIRELKGKPQEEWTYRKYFMTQNYLFPCNFVQIMTDHVYVHSIIPTGPGTCVFKCMMLISEPANTDKAKQYWEKNYNVVKEVFNEDFEIGEAIQAGLSTNANDNFIFGKYECGLHWGQQAIDDALEGRLKAS